MEQKRFTRRGLLAAAAAPMIVPSRVLGQRAGAVAPSDKIVMAGLGIGNRGGGDMQALLTYPQVQVVAVCDVRDERREAIKSAIDKRYGNRNARMYAVHEDLLARDDIDAILIAAGERWHTLLSIYAARAGKDVYCEKPCGSTIAQDQALRAAFNRYGRVYQAGCQRRNGDNFVFAVELARNGKLGKLQSVHAQTIGGQSPITTHSWLPPEPEPARQVVDWDRWLGPCPWRPFNSTYLRGGAAWATYFDFHGGSILEWGTHTVDLCQWAAGMDHTHAVEYEPHCKDSATEPHYVIGTYPNGVKLFIRNQGGDFGTKPWMGLGSCSVRFEGSDGWVETGDSGKVEVSDNLKGELHPFRAANLALAFHLQEFLDCVKSRGVTRANHVTVANTHITCHAAQLSAQLGRKLTWNPVKEEFVNDAEANRMRSRAMREPWRI